MKGVWAMEYTSKGAWMPKELRYSPPANALVALTLQDQDSRDTRIRVRRISELRYRQVRFPVSRVRVQDFILATGAPVGFAIAWTPARKGGFDQEALFRVDLRNLQARRIPITPTLGPGKPNTSWIWKLVGVNARGTKVYVALGRERPATSTDRRRMRAHWAKFEPGLAKRFGAKFSKEVMAGVGSTPTSLDYVVVEYSVATGKRRDLGLLHLGVA